MPTVLACLRRSVERMWPRRVPTRFGPATRLRRPKNQWNQGPLATQQAEMCPRTANSGQRLRRRYLAVRDSLFTFLEHPEAPSDNNGSERDLRPLVVYRKVTGGFRSGWGAGPCAAVEWVVAPAPRRGIDAYHAIHAVLSGRTVLAPS